MFKGIKGRVITTALVLSLGATLFIGCGGKNVSDKTQGNEQQAVEKSKSNGNKEDSKLEYIKKSGKLVLGTSADYPPYEFHIINGGEDRIVGFDIKIAEEVAKDLGVKLEVKDMKFEGLIPSLKTSKVDMLIAGMNPDAERRKEVDFSKIYYKAIHKVIIRKEDKDKYKDIESLTGKKIGAQKTTTQEKIAKEQIKNSNVMSLSKVDELVLALKTKKVDAIIVENPVAKAYSQKNSDIMVADIKLGNPSDGSAIAVQKGNPKLVEAVNKTIDRLVSEGKIDKFFAEADQLSNKN